MLSYLIDIAADLKLLLSEPLPEEADQQLSARTAAHLIVRRTGDVDVR
jgi:hypothetical protein